MSDQVFNTDPQALSADEYWSDYQQFSTGHPMTGPAPDEYEEEPDGDDR